MALLSSSSIRFRAIEPEDLDILYHWENNTAFWEVGVTLALFSKYILRQYITESHKDIYELRQVRFIIELSNTHTPIGLADLFDFDPHNSRAAIGILIDTPFQKKGYAKQALALLEEYAFSFLKIHQLYAHIPEKNQASLQLFLKSGYGEHGIFKEWLRTIDGYQDVRLLQKINSNKGL